jgi:hypothetical protein
MMLQCQRQSSQASDVFVMQGSALCPKCLSPTNCHFYVHKGTKGKAEFCLQRQKTASTRLATCCTKGPYVQYLSLHQVLLPLSIPTPSLAKYPNLHDHNNQTATAASSTMFAPLLALLASTIAGIQYLGGWTADNSIYQFNWVQGPSGGFFRTRHHDVSFHIHTLQAERLSTVMVGIVTAYHDIPVTSPSLLPHSPIPKASPSPWEILIPTSSPFYLKITSISTTPEVGFTGPLTPAPAFLLPSDPYSRLPTRAATLKESGNLKGDDLSQAGDYRLRQILAILLCLVGVFIILGFVLFYRATVYSLVAVRNTQVDKQTAVENAFYQKTATTLADAYKTLAAKADRARKCTRTKI